MRLTRRRLVLAGGVFAGAALAGVATGATPPAPRAGTGGVDPAAGDGTTRPEGVVKRLSLVNLHTNERLESTYFSGDAYVLGSLAAIQVFLRDYRNGEQHVIDPKLMDYLYDVARHIGAAPVFSVISGYRSPQTNEQLRARSDGVARHSLHMQGRAIDVRLAGVDCAELAARALELGRGGVGYYRQSNFVHLDTGPLRTWNG